MDKDKIEFLDLKRSLKTIAKEQKKETKSTEDSFSKIATNPISGAFLDFTRLKKFNINDLKDL